MAEMKKEGIDVPKKKRTTKKKQIENLPERKIGTVEEVSTKTLQKHQLEFAKNFVYGDIRGAMAIHGVGSGKTLTAIICAEMFLDKTKDDGKKHDIVVITPASLLSGFKQELYTYDPAIEGDKRYKFYTYDGFSNAVQKERGATQSICKNSMLIIDEGQNLRTKIKVYTSSDFDQETKTISTTETIKSGAKVYHILKDCALLADKVLVLSATPLVNSPEDIENLMAMINGHLPLKLSSKTFNKLWSNPKIAQRYFGCRLSFFENSPEIRDKYFPRMTELYVEIVMNKATLEAYNAIERGVPSNKLKKQLNIPDDFGSLESFYNGVRRASNAINGAHSQKINFLISFIKGVLSKKPNSKIGLSKKMIDTHTDKSIIFTHFLGNGSKLIIDRLKKEKIPFGSINGSVSKTKRAKIVDDYVSGKIKVILISKAGAEGLNLLETGYIFMVEPSWNNAEREQVKGRGVRFMSHINLPREKQNVLVLSLFLIRPNEKQLFDKLLKGDADAYKEAGYSQKGEQQSIDLKLFVLSNAKQDYLDKALNELRKTDPVENCEQPREFLDVSNLFDVSRQGNIPPLSNWEKKFYTEIIKNDNVELPPRKKDDDNFTMPELRKKMIEFSRQLHSSKESKIGNKELIFTPPNIAKDMIDFSGISLATNNVLFLEPSAGLGFIIYEALLNPNVFCNAIEPVKQLREFIDEFPRTEILAVNNFFDLPSNYKYRVAIFHPPRVLRKGDGFRTTKTYDVDFVMKAFLHLEDDGILVAFISNDYETKKDPKKKTEFKTYETFRKLLKSNEHEIINYGDVFTDTLVADAKNIGEVNFGMRMIKILKKSE